VVNEYLYSLSRVIHYLMFGQDLIISAIKHILHNYLD